MNFSAILKSFRSSVRDQGLIHALGMLVRRASIRAREQRLGIRTEALIFLPELGIDNPECNEYQATDYAVFDALMSRLDIDPSEHVFLDYGAGMGRVMVLAAMHPFKRVVGVELSAELADIARSNIRNSLPRLRCKDVSVTTGDATQYEIDPDVTLCYFNNSFTGVVLDAVLDRLRNFVQREHSLMLVCNVPHKSPFEDQIRRQAWLVMTKEQVLSGDRKCLVLRGEKHSKSAP